MTDRLKEIGLMKGDTDEALAAGAHAMFLPHGLGHMMGMDVHDMEGLGQIYVGFDEETRPNLEQFGTNCLRMGRKLEEGFVMTDEPGIYFIPALIDDWKAKGHCKDFLNYEMLETYKDFGGIRIEDDILITKEGCRFLGTKRIPYHPEELEEFMVLQQQRKRLLPKTLTSLYSPSSRRIRSLPLRIRTVQVPAGITRPSHSSKLRF